MKSSLTHLNQINQLSEKGQRSYLNILKHAKEIFSLQGYDQFSLRNIAKQASVSLAAIQHYFPNKELLLLTLIDQEIQAYDRQWQDLLEKQQLSSEGAEPALIMFTDELLNLHSDPKASGFILQFWALAHKDTRVKEKKDQFYQSFLNKIEQTLAQTKQDLSQSERQTRARLIASTLEGSLIFISGKKANSPDVITLKQAVRNQVIQLLN